MTAAQPTGCAEQGGTMEEGTVLPVQLHEKMPAVLGKKKRERGSEDQPAGPPAKPRKQGKIQTTLTTYLSAPGPTRSPAPVVKSPFFPSPSADPTAPQPRSPIPPSLHALLTTHPALPRFRRLVLLTLCQVPRSRTTTYAALARVLGSHPRAVGNAVRHNPFAPRVPCHRVVASGGGIGGFAGEWGDGARVADKVRLLRDEGVVVEEVGLGWGRSGQGKKARWRVRGEVWDGFVPVGDVAVAESVVSV